MGNSHALKPGHSTIHWSWLVTHLFLPCFDGREMGGMLVGRCCSCLNLRFPTSRTAYVHRRMCVQTPPLKR